MSTPRGGQSLKQLEGGSRPNSARVPLLNPATVFFARAGDTKRRPSAKDEVTPQRPLQGSRPVSSRSSVQHSPRSAETHCTTTGVAPLLAGSAGSGFALPQYGTCAHHLVPGNLHHRAHGGSAHSLRSHRKDSVPESIVLEATQDSSAELLAGVKDIVEVRRKSYFDGGILFAVPGEDAAQPVRSEDAASHGGSGGRYPPSSPRGHVLPYEVVVATAISPRKDSSHPQLLPDITALAHQARQKSVREESITRAKRPNSGVKPPFGTTEYVRPSLLKPQERELNEWDAKIVQRFLAHQVPTLAQQLEDHFRTFEPVGGADTAKCIDSFEVRLREVELKREQEAKELQQQREGAMSPVPVVDFPSVSNVHGSVLSPSAFGPSLKGASKVLISPRSMNNLSQFRVPHKGNSPLSGSPEVELPPPPTNREYHLIKTLFRRELLVNNSLVKCLRDRIGVDECIARLQLMNDRYGARRLTADDFYYLMQELVTAECVLSGEMHSSRSNSPSVEDVSVVLTTTASQRNTSSPSGRSGPHSDGPTMLRSDQLAAADRASSSSSNGSPAKQPNLFASSADLLATVTTRRELTEQQMLLRSFSRGDSDILFKAFDWRMIDVVDNGDLVDAVKLLFAPQEKSIAAHCKKVLEGRCSISDMISMHEVEVLLRAVIDVSKHRYIGIAGELEPLLEMFRPVESQGHIPLVCFRNFIVHAPMMSRALAEMTLNAELPLTKIKAPSPDPDRDIERVREAARQQTKGGRPKPAGLVASNSFVIRDGPTSPARARRESMATMTDMASFRIAATAVSFIARPPEGTRGVYGLELERPTSGAVHQQRDLSHHRFKADQNIVHGKIDEEISEHDRPVWYSSGGIVWMSNQLHGPQAVSE